MNIPVSNCSSCAACANVCTRNAITMQLDIEGFYRPVIDKEKCISCGACEKICPWLHTVENPNQSETPPETIAAYAKDDEIRSASSSGGIFTILAEKILEEGGVVVGVAQLEPSRFGHIIVKNKSELAKFRGSKYVQANPGKIYCEIKKIITDGQIVLFSGTPCQIAALYAVLGHSDLSKLFTIDVLCSRIPSVKVFEKYIADFNRDNIRRVDFRNKIFGWRNFCLAHQFDSNEFKIPFEKTPYMRLFLSRISGNTSCFDCHYRKLPRIADITLGDFWGIEKIHPQMDDDKGTSVVLLNTKHGKNLFNSISKNIIKCLSQIEFAASSNPGLKRYHRVNPKRSQFFKELDQLTLDQITYKYCMTFLEKITYNLFVRFHKKAPNHYFAGLWSNPFIPLYAQIWKGLHLPNTNIRGKIKRVLTVLFKK